MRRVLALVLAYLALSVPVSAQVRLRAAGVPPAPGVVTITTTTLDNGQQNVVYVSATIMVTGGTAPYTCAVTSGSLPTGLSLSSACILSGTPTGTGASSFTVTATDAVMATDPQAFTVTIAAAALLSGYSSGDVGTQTGTAGTCAYVSGTGVWTLTSAGANIYDTADSFQYCYTTATDTFTYTAEITGITGYQYAQAGIDVRESIQPNAAHMFSYMMPATNGDLNACKYRLTSGAITTNASSSQSAREFVQLRRAGNAFSCWNSTTGLDGSWAQAGTTQTIAMSSVINVGLACTNIQTTTSATCLFDNVVLDDADPVEPDPEDDTGNYSPGFSGNGTSTPGGRYGAIIHVNSLLDNGDGGNTTFREAVTTAGARFIVFDVAGTIHLTSLLSITNPYMTIAGQTAVSPGITIAGYSIYIMTHDIVVQHVRFRQGNASCGACAPDSVTDLVYVADNANNLVFDHVSYSWGQHENVGMNAVYFGVAPTNITFLDCITAEPLGLNAFNTSINMLFTVNSNGGGARSSGTVQRTLFAHATNRNPWFADGWDGTHINNVVYNAGSVALDDGTQGMTFLNGGYGTNKPIRFVSIGNVYIRGPKTHVDGLPYKLYQTSGAVSAGAAVYLADNSFPSVGSTPAVNQWSLVTICGVSSPGCGNTPTASASTEANTKITTLPSWYLNLNVTPMPNASVLTYVLANAGARPLNRDATDTRIVADVTAGTGTSGLWITSQTQTAEGGWSATTGSGTYSNPANPNNPGTCGITTAGVTRTIIECDLLTKKLALEP